MPNEFLDVPERDPICDILLPENDDSISMSLHNDDVKVRSIKPVPGFCMKLLDDKGGKIFINVCSCPEIPEPANISEQELSKILDSDEASSYRVPMSIGEAREEKDKGGNVCTCYDVVINSNFYQRVKTSELFNTFITSLAFESVQDKYDLSIDSDSCIIMKNKAYHGNIPNHYIRDKPLIAELNSNALEKKPVLKERTPQFILRRKPPYGNAMQLFMDVHLPGVVTGDTVSVHMGEDQVSIFEKTRKFELNICLPIPVDSPNCVAEFDVVKKVLSITMPTFLYVKK